jgi:hypothetical protein
MQLAVWVVVCVHASEKQAAAGPLSSASLSSPLARKLPLHRTPDELAE